ncbi:helix-turn-helix domain-containing protein [Phytomonospora sp. NPDC050363]|uniref:helix-turn-helix domain-containing protein n=1 Tax=Phytomonospora sp. NPDC050363 TaxID=3155642 RepID=UPI0033F68142
MNVSELLNALRAVRVQKGILAKDTANALGVTPTSLRDWETGRHMPSLDRLVKWAAFLGVEIAPASPDARDALRPRVDDDPDQRAERLLGAVFAAAIEIHDEDLTVVHRRLTGRTKADLVSMLVLAAACIPPESTRRDLLSWWTGAGLRLADLVSTCSWCHSYFGRARDDRPRAYCTPECKIAARRDRRHLRAVAA